MDVRGVAGLGMSVGGGMDSRRWVGIRSGGDGWRRDVSRWVRGLVGFERWRKTYKS